MVIGEAVQMRHRWWEAMDSICDPAGSCDGGRTAVTCVLAHNMQSVCTQIQTEEGSGTHSVLCLLCRLLYTHMYLTSFEPQQAETHSYPG